MNGIPILGRLGERQRLIDSLEGIVRMAKDGALDGYVCVAFKTESLGRRQLHVGSSQTPGESVLLLLHAIDAYKGGLSTGGPAPEGPGGLVL